MLKSKILALLKPIQIFMQRLGRKETIMTEAMANHLASLVQPGDILLSYEAQRFTSMFIPGQWDHAAIVTSKMSVMEAVGDKFIKIDVEKERNLGGVKESGLLEWIYKKDHVCILRPLFDHDELGKLDKEINKTAAANSFKYKGQSYDYAFNIANEEIYCSELVYLCYQSEIPSFMDYIKGEILPQDYLEACELKDREYTIIQVFNTRLDAISL